MSSMGSGKTMVVFFSTPISVEGLEVAELEGHGLGSHEGGGFDELGGGVEFAFGVDDLGAAFAFGFSLLGHGAEHVFRHVDLFDFDGDDLDAEGAGVAVDDGLDAEVELVAVGEDLVEVDFTEDGAEGGLGVLAGLVDVVGDLDDGVCGVDDAEGDDGVDLEGDVVSGDDVLRGTSMASWRREMRTKVWMGAKTKMRPGPEAVSPTRPRL